MSDNPNIQRVGNEMFNLLMVDDWLLGLFRTNHDIWRFLEYLGKQLEAGEPVPKEVHIFTVTTTVVSGCAEIVVLETAKLSRIPIRIYDEEEPEERFVYTAIHEDAEVKRLTEIVQKSYAQIMEVLL